MSSTDRPSTRSRGFAGRERSCPLEVPWSPCSGGLRSLAQPKELLEPEGLPHVVVGITLQAGHGSRSRQVESLLTFGGHVGREPDGWEALLDEGGAASNWGELMYFYRPLLRGR